jgi:NAD-dependent dihydropyrimidine dehydrogenase PreA subunit
MAHDTARTGYHRLVGRLNRLPQGAPPSTLLFDILRILMDEREAALLSQVPIRAFTVQKAAAVWRLPEREARHMLEVLAERALLVDFERDGEWLYVLPPPMAGFFEFSMMRLRGDIDQKALAELFYEYLNVQEDFVRELFAGGETQLGRVFVHETVIGDDDAIHVFEFERASASVRDASCIAIGTCYCRHKMQHLDRACDAPMEICMTLGTTADSLARHGYARRVDAAEGLELLSRARERGLVQFGENVQREVSFICNCCGCCCEALIAARRFAALRPIHTSPFMPAVAADRCRGCGRCVRACPVETLALVGANDPRNPRRLRAVVDERACLGCGVCVPACPERAVVLHPRPARVITPLDSAHRIVMMAIERGKLGELIFDGQDSWTHRSLAAVVNALLSLPPVKWKLASQQVRSRFVEALLAARSRRQDRHAADH